MADDQINALGLLADGLTLVYHEARHVRHLIKAGHVSIAGWERLVGLPKNRVAAWKGLEPHRTLAARMATGRESQTVFEKRFGRKLEDLESLYDDPHWKHASAVGGHAWRNVTTLVVALLDSIEQANPAAIENAYRALLRGRHNKGSLSHKVLELDAQTGFATGTWWNSVGDA